MGKFYIFQKMGRIFLWVLAAHMGKSGAGYPGGTFLLSGQPLCGGNRDSPGTHTVEKGGMYYVDTCDAAAAQRPFFIPASGGKRRKLSQAPQPGGGAALPGPLYPGRPGGQECAGGEKYAVGGAYY